MVPIVDVSCGIVTDSVGVNSVGAGTGVSGDVGIGIPVGFGTGGVAGVVIPLPIGAGGCVAVV
jgi:hypothetical protein